MWRLIKALFFLCILGFIALSGYAYLGDLRPPTGEMRETVTFDAQ
ncbi:hypothetical protein Ga0609869_002233 [Rhodovulum iodosum]|uniref:Uncharacterized protein n=1 Tax=Rhodovulum iodosum TaxID=68291 RepID=A0ABV3XU63_9RHOB|nr:hypothetical protein [Rhodovulum robiginosum]